MRRKSFVLMVMGTVIFFLCSVSSALVPDSINYQGKLTTASGGCLNDTVQMIFSIYPDTATGTTADWTETQAQVVVKEGIFNVILGSVNPIPDTVFDGGVKYLGVQVESDPEMRPLKPMVSVAYAYKAVKADTADYALTGAGIGGSGTANYICKFTAPTTIGNSVIYETSGNIGIGTTSPTSRLHVVDATASPQLKVEGFGTTTIMTAQSDWGSVGTLNAKDFVIFANNVERVRINQTNGNVGIGTASPAYKLDVVGNADAVVSATNSYTTGMPKAIFGLASPGTGQTRGVWGQTNSSTDYAVGVLGLANAGSGKTMGLYGKTNSATAGACGVYGTTSAGATYGVKGYSTSTTNGNAAVYGDADGGGICYGVYGQTGSWTGGAAGVYGLATSASGATYGVYGETNSSSGYGVYGKAPSGGYAVYSSGAMRTTGQISSTVSTGTAPLSVSSTTKCNNLNADMVDGKHASELAKVVSGTVSGNSSVNITFTHLTACQLWVSDNSVNVPDAVGWISFYEQNNYIRYVGLNGDGTTTHGCKYEGSTSTILTVTTSPDIKVECTGSAGSHQLKIRCYGSQAAAYKLIY